MHVLEHDRTYLYAHPEAELTLEQERAYRHLVRERGAGKPTQYLTGRQEFWGLSFRVEPGVFIPRPETEHVVEVALDIVRNRLSKPTARIVDVGTGSGCIALALASELPSAEIFATDISTQALTVARHNAEALELADRIQFLESDLLSVFLEAGKQGSKEADEAKETTEARPATRDPRPVGYFDLVVANPPYVSPEESAQLPREVREYEPAAALFSPDEGLAITRRLIDQAAALLAPAAGGPRVTEGHGFNRAEEMQEESWALAPEGERVAGLPAGARRGGAQAGHGESPVAEGGPALRSPQGEGGWLVLELGYQMAGRVRALLGEGWTNIEITDDLRGIPRVLAAQKR
jgi:release factor glutamine methyltransferase